MTGTHVPVCKLEERTIVDIGSYITAQRAERGWTQAMVAKRLGVQQQTVSRWESGTSRPDANSIRQLGELFGIPVATLLAAADDRRLTDEDTGVDSLPVRPTVDVLPLGQLTPDRFEQFCRDFVRALRRTEDVHRYGSQGDTQHGIDLIARRSDGTVEIFQCKRHAQFGPAKVRRAIDDTKFSADHYVLVLSRPSASPEARDEVARHPDWSLWDGEDISTRIRHDLDRDAATRLVDTYFPGWREPFLGIREPGPWLTEDEFFLPFASELYSHDLQLVGRDPQLNEIARFAIAGDAIVGVIVGRGGIGKTRLLREIARATRSNTTVDVRFISTAHNVEPHDLELLPRDRSLLVIVDDAHDRSDMRALLDGIATADLDCRLLIALRPHALAGLRSDLRHVGLRLDDLPYWELDDLEVQDAEDLARATMDSEANELVVRRLARATSDCPLVTVVGGRLIQRGDLDPNRLESSRDIRTEILSAFRDALVGDPTSGDPELRHATLNAVAALQPVRVDDPAMRSALADLTGVPFDRVSRELHGLEDGGILLHRGRSVRIVPDLLGDVILTSACFDDRSQITTGYVDRVMAAADGTAAQHMLVNASRIDWQLSQRQATTNLSDAVWSRLESEYRSAGIRGRRELTKLLTRAAFYQPERALHLVQWAIDHPTSETEDSDDPLLEAFLRENPPSYADVLREIPPALQSIAYTFDHISEALDLLWQLAQRDTRPVNQHPEHPLRVLKDLAAYEPGKPLAYNTAVLAAAERWLDHNLSPSSLFSPFDVLEPLLMTEGTEHTTRRMSITFSPYGLRPDAIRDVRDRVIGLAIREAVGPDPQRAVRALQAIESGLRYPGGLHGRTVTEDERESWTPIFVSEIKRLSSIARRNDLDPVVAIAIRRALQWHANYSPSTTKTAARRVIHAIGPSLERDLALAMYSGWPRLMWGREFDHAEVSRRRDEWLDELAARLTAVYSENALVDLLETRIELHMRAFGQQQSLDGQVVAVVVGKAPTVGGKICDRINTQPQSALQSALSPVLSRLALSRPDETISHARALIAVDNDVVSRHVAHAFGWGRSGRMGLIEGERELLPRLAEHRDTQTRLAAARAPQLIHSIDYSYAIDLLTRVKFSDSEAIASEICMAFTAHGFAKWEDIDFAQRNRLLDQLTICPSVGEYHIIEFISKLSMTDADFAVSLLTKRVETAEQQPSNKNYHALPYDWSTPLRFREHPEFPRILRIIRDWITANPETWQRRRMGARLFRAAAITFDTEVTNVLRESFLTGSTRDLETIVALLREAPRALVFHDVDFVTEALETAAQHGSEYLRRMSAALHEATNDHVRSGIVGQPFSEDIEQQARAAEIAGQIPQGTHAAALYRSLEQAAINNNKWQSETDAELPDGRSW